jgi:hypothetical protein
MTTKIQLPGIWGMSRFLRRTITPRSALSGIGHGATHVAQFRGSSTTQLCRSVQKERTVRRIGKGPAACGRRARGLRPSSLAVQEASPELSHCNDHIIQFL